MREKPTDEQIVVMTQQYDRTRDGEFIVHLAYDEINRQGSEGRQWAKCPNCGNPYPLDKPGAGDTVCSTECFEAYAAYVTNSDSF